MESLLSLSEFAAAAATAVAASGAVPDNRQAKAVPAERMIRYYTSRGLLPRPGTRGRALTYGRTHLVRLVAIKRLQGEGLSLDEIARRLDELTPAAVEALAAIPPAAMPVDLGDPDPGPAEAARAAGAFWRTVPAAASAPSPPDLPRAVSNLQAVRLSDTVTVLVDGTQSLPDLDLLRNAAAPLLDLLARPRKENE